MTERLIYNQFLCCSSILFTGDKEGGGGEVCGEGEEEKDFFVFLVTFADVFEIKLKLICSETVDTIGKSTSEHTGAFFIYLFYPAFNFFVLCFIS